MVKTVFRFLFSSRFSIILLLVFSLAQIYATLGFPSDVLAWRYVYGSVWFELILWLLGINLLAVLIRYKTYKKLPIFFLHISIIVILLGAAATRYGGYSGVLHLRVGESSSKIVIQNRADPRDISIEDIGFSVRLDDFVVHKYIGSFQPSSYDSYITIMDSKSSFPYHIYMNHILVYKGFRIYQMSYDGDERGSILFVSYDPGMYITYFGYILLILGFLMTMLYKKSRFFKSVKSLKHYKAIAGFAIFFLSFSYSCAGAMTISEWAGTSKTAAALWGDILVQFNGRIEPADTLDMNVIYKISKRRKIENMDYNQIVLGMLTYPALFQSLKMVYIGNKALREMLDIEGKYSSYNNFFSDTGQFKLSRYLDMAMKKPPDERNEIDRELLNINERLYIAYSVYTGSIFNIFPSKYSYLHNYKWYSLDEMDYMGPKEAKRCIGLFKDLILNARNGNIRGFEKAKNGIYEIQKKYSPKSLISPQKAKLEIFYNRAAIFPSLIGAYSLLGVALILMGFAEILKGVGLKRVEIAAAAAGWIILLAHTANMILRWYISGHLPWSDAYESIIFIAWSSAFVSLVFFVRFMLALGAGFLVAGMFMMVAHLSSIDPQITNMVPVLKSYWLLIHVAVITLGYGFAAVAFMVGLLNMGLFIPKNRPMDKIGQINRIIHTAIYAGLVFLSIGTLLGGVWANESWGRYWSWDPKETWSLITIIAYTVVLHLHVIKKERGGFMLPLLASLSFFFILMTYFGVNFYIAQGLHSYGRGGADYAWFYVLKGGIFVWFCVVLYYAAENFFARRKRSKP